MGIDDSLPGNAAPYLASSIDTLSIGDIARNWLELDRKSALNVSRVCLFRHTQAREKKRFSLREEAKGAAFSENGSSCFEDALLLERSARLLERLSLLLVLLFLRDLVLKSCTACLFLTDITSFH